MQSTLENSVPSRNVQQRGGTPALIRGTRPTPPPQSSIRRKTVQWLLIFVTVVLMVDALVGEKGLIETMKARRQAREFAGLLARLREENAALREEARRLREDPSTIESLARQELGLIRSGEILFILKDVRPAAAP
jgi:cell division protein FtsB